ncbi:hypothetical protein ACFRFJ_15720 [Streptomyces hydrogenans]|uniref:hypothetical protein n=1 Tax=Streptomyces hydrogenans TaxID=1873719 RepID=UPI0036A18115
MTATTLPTTPQAVASAILSAVESNPHAFDMGTWYSPTGTSLDLAPDAPIPAGITLDVASWAARVTGWTLTTSGHATKGGTTQHVSSICRAALGITEQSPALFWLSDDRALTALRNLADRR